MVEANEDALNLIKKPHTTSNRWAHFGLVGDEKGVPVPGEIDKPICRHCNKAVLAKRLNTTNLFCHLEDHHPEVYAEMTRATQGKGIKRKQPTLVDVIEKAKRYDPKSQKVWELNRAVACFLAWDMQPFYTVEVPGFKQMVEMLAPK